MAGSIVGGIIGGKKQAKAAGRAAAALQEATDWSINEQRGARDYTMDAYAPVANVLATALPQLVEGIQSGAFDPRNYNFEADPGYQFRLDEGQKALDRSAAARGGLLSGSQLKAGQRYAQDYASNEYDRGYNRNANALAAVLGQYGSLVDLGLGGVGAQTGAMQNFANNAGQIKMQGTGAVQNALMSKANAKANMWNSIGGGISQGLGMAFGGFGSPSGWFGSGTGSAGASAQGSAFGGRNWGFY